MEITRGKSDCESQAPTSCREERLSWDFLSDLEARIGRSWKSFHLEGRWQSMWSPAGGLVLFKVKSNEGDIECREEEVARIDMERMVVVAGQEEDETSLLVKDNDANIIKGVPVYSEHVM